MRPRPCCRWSKPRSSSSTAWPALHDAIREDKIFPVLFTSGLGNVGVDKLMDFLVDYTPAGTEHTALHGVAGSNGQEPERHVADSDALSLFVFKTVSDPFAGRI